MGIISSKSQQFINDMENVKDIDAASLRKIQSDERIREILSRCKKRAAKGANYYKHYEWLPSDDLSILKSHKFCVVTKRTPTDYGVRYRYTISW